MVIDKDQNRMKYVSGAGRDVGLSVVLDVEEQTYYGSIRPSFGASILIHDPYSYPEVELLTSFVQPTQETAVILSASVVESNSDVRILPFTQRDCRFSGEIKLKTTPKYSYQSCMTECRIRFIKKYCHCVPFYYQNFMNARVCTPSDIGCLTKNRGSFSGLKPEFDLTTEIYDNDTDSDATCECYPACEDNTYTFNSENQLMENVHFHLPILDDFDVKNVSLASIYFRGITCLKYKKEAHMSWDNVIASIGGIFGLCIGGSIVSLIEFLYYFTHKMMSKSEPESNEPPLAREVFKVASVENLNDFACQRLDNEILQRNNQVGQGHTKRKDEKHVTMKPDLEGDFIKYFVKDIVE
ncbi:hypothetical protein QAD02_022486 [Eretmocerus hayati]|uniref:Uncharacterized protein n=1 Tax=Eretmocerus hayati TaxID=131215 RepID=A0ACC2PTE4_9HYME|nr:hypothetical protein QAD02_022486 [Eretmocerus hayati]